MKKKIALFLACILAFSLTTPAFASLPSPGEIIGEGDVPGLVIIDAPLSAVIPTNGNLDFVIDPLGLLGLTSAAVVNLEPVTNEVTFLDGVNTLAAHNTSAIPVILTVELSVNNALGNNAASGAIPVADEPSVNPSSTDRNILFWLEPNEEDLGVAAPTAATEFSGIGRVIAFGDHANPVTVSYRLGAIPHELLVTTVVPGPPTEITATVTRVDATDFNATAFRFGGIFNQNADWAEGAPADVGIKAVFSVFPANYPAVYDGYLLDSDGVQVAHGLLGDQVAISVSPGSINASAPALIDMPTPFVGGLPAEAGFIVSGQARPDRGLVNATAGVPVEIPFTSAGEDINRIAYTGPISLIPSASWNYNAGTGVITITVSGLQNNRQVVIVLEDDTRFYFRMTVSS